MGIERFGVDPRGWAIRAREILWTISWYIGTNKRVLDTGSSSLAVFNLCATRGKRHAHQTIPLMKYLFQHCRPFPPDNSPVFDHWPSVKRMWMVRDTNHLEVWSSTERYHITRGRRVLEDFKTNPRVGKYLHELNETLFIYAQLWN